jgi:hypothetical protein
MQSLIRIPGAPASNFDTGKGSTVVDLINAGDRLEKVLMQGAEAKGVNCPAIDGILEEASDVAREILDGAVHHRRGLVSSPTSMAPHRSSWPSPRIERRPSV